MKRPFGNTHLSNLILFVFMFALTLSAGFWTQSLSRERGSFQVILTPAGDSVSASEMVSVLDLANQGVVKRLLQPDKVSVTTGHRAGILNKRTGPIWVGFRATGFSSRVKVDAHDLDYNSQKSRFERPVNPGESVNIEVQLTLPKDLMHREEVDSGVVEIIDFKTGEVLAQVPIKVVNSR